MWRMRHLAAIRRVMKRQDDRRPVWATEFGWSSHRKVAGDPAWKRGVSQTEQARYAVRAMKLLGRDYPYVKKAFWYKDLASGTPGVTTTAMPCCGAISRPSRCTARSVVCSGEGSGHTRPVRVADPARLATRGGGRGPGGRRPRAGAGRRRAAGDGGLPSWAPAGDGASCRRRGGDLVRGSGARGADPRGAGRAVARDPPGASRRRTPAQLAGRDGGAPRGSRPDPDGVQPPRLVLAAHERGGSAGGGGLGATCRTLDAGDRLRERRRAPGRARAAHPRVAAGDPERRRGRPRCSDRSRQPARGQARARPR